MTENCKDHATQMACVSEIAKSMALLQKDVEYLRRDQEAILARFGKHVEDAEKEGGRHERLAATELAINNMQAQRTNDLIVMRWFMIGSGLIGGLIGAGAPEAFTKLFHVLGIG